MNTQEALLFVQSRLTVDSERTPCSSSDESHSLRRGSAQGPAAALCRQRWTHPEWRCVHNWMCPERWSFQRGRAWSSKEERQGMVT